MHHLQCERQQLPSSSWSLFHFWVGLKRGAQHKHSQSRQGKKATGGAAVIIRSMVEDLLHTCIVLVNANPCDSEHHEHYNIEEDGWRDASDWADHFEHWLQKDPQVQD